MKAFLGLAAVLWVGSQAAIALDASVAQGVEAAPRQAAVQPPADDGDVSEARAAQDLAVAQVRLNLVRARKALKDERLDEALRLTESVQAWLRKLPAGVDVSVYELQAEGILARLAKANKLPGAPLTAGSAPPDETAATSPAASSETKDEKSASEHVAPAPYDQSRLAEQRDAQGHVSGSDLNVLIRSDEARVAPDQVLSYPSDWPQIVEKRREYSDGAIYRSPSHTGSDGKEWNTAVYDLSELSYVVPDFAPPALLDLVDSTESALYRDAVRFRSEIFSGYAEDLAAGIPLLRFFGSAGLDPLVLRGPKYSREKTQQIVEMIRASADKSTDPKIIILPYTP
jgi:hypothetical protein